MKKITMTVLTVFSVLQLFSCSTSKARVIRMENEINKAEFVDADQTTAKAKVAEGANEFCEKEGRKAIVVTENVTFSGTFDEKTTNAIKTAGVIGSVFGGQDAANASGAATDDARYTAVMMFKCQ